MVALDALALWPYYELWSGSACNVGSVTVSVGMRNRNWCPGEDLNLHALASTST